MMRLVRAVVPLVILVGCEGGIHRLLEAPPPPYIRLSITVDPPSVTVARGAELTFTATVTRTGEDRGPVSVTVDGAPTGVTASTKSSTTAGDITTAVLSIRAAADAPVGNYSVTVRAHASQATDAGALLVLTVIDPPDFAIAATKSSLTIARGGIARVGVKLSRTNVSASVALTATSDAGITAQLASNPLAGDTTTATIAVDPGVATGTHSVVLHANATGLGERTATVIVDVTNDPLQVLVQGDLSTPQLSAAAQDVIVNSVAAASAVTLSVEGLPPNVVATFDPLSGTASATRLRLDVAGTSPAGSYPVTVRARASGVPDAIATFTLQIVLAGISFSVAPATATVFAGVGTTASLSISRANFSGAVVFSTDPLPPGLSVSFDSSSLASDKATAVVTAAPNTTPGTYSLTFRASPAGLAATAVQSASMAVTVVAPTASGNVVLEWSNCTAPDWVAIQDGSALWTRLTGSDGIFVGSVSSNTGAIAFVERGTSVTVRYMVQGELTAHPLDMCGPKSGARSVSGTAVHGSSTELGAYSLGGGSGSSSASQPAFSIAGVPDGTHDLIAHSYFQNGAYGRVVIRRDIAVGPTTDSIAPVNFQGSESFTLVSLSPAVTLTGPVVAGEAYTYSLNYLTTAACNGGLLYTSPSFTFSSSGQLLFAPAMVGVPAALQRPDDYHQITVWLNGNNTFRTSSITFHAAGSHSLQIAPLLPTTTVASIAGPYKRLQATFGSVATPYNRTISLDYGDGVKTMAVSASRAYVDASAGVLEMPDLSSVAGWPSSAAVPSGATGGWRFTLDGATSDASACTENRVTYSSGRTGVF